jgi:hypothetical protein
MVGLEANDHVSGRPNPPGPAFPTSFAALTGKGGASTRTRLRCAWVVFEPVGFVFHLENVDVIVGEW